MKLFVVIAIIVCVVALEAAAASDNVVLGSASGMRSSEFGAGASETHFQNINGIKQKVTTHTSFEQKADGSCVKKVVEEKNGVTSVSEEAVDCEEARAEVQQQGAETQKEINENSRKLNKEIQQEQKRIQESIDKQMQEMNSRFRF